MYAELPGYLISCVHWLIFGNTQVRINETTMQNCIYIDQTIMLKYCM